MLTLLDTGLGWVALDDSGAATLVGCATLVVVVLGAVPRLLEDVIGLVVPGLAATVGFLRVSTRPLRAEISSLILSI